MEKYNSRINVYKVAILNRYLNNNMILKETHAERKISRTYELAMLLFGIDIEKESQNSVL